MICIFHGLGGQGCMVTTAGRRVLSGEKFESEEVHHGTLEAWVKRGIASKVSPVVAKPEPEQATPVVSVVPEAPAAVEPSKTKKGKKNG